MNQSLTMKTFLAAIAGFTVSLLYSFGPAAEHPVGWFLQYGMSGALFAVTVLWPYLRKRPDCLYRGLGLITASIFSYWSAVTVATEWQQMNFAFLLASGVALAIILASARLIVPLPGARHYIAPVAVAALLGGLAMDAAVATNTPTALSLGFVAWHCLVAIAMHTGQRRAHVVYLGVLPARRQPF